MISMGTDSVEQDVSIYLPSKGCIGRQVMISVGTDSVEQDVSIYLPSKVGVV